LVSEAIGQVGDSWRSVWSVTDHVAGPQYFHSLAHSVSTTYLSVYTSDVLHVLSHELIDLSQIFSTFS
jgi:hypothetical protein